MHILLIEPDHLLRETYRQAFEAKGYTVDVTASAQDAVHLADEHQPDAVVLELQLRGHNGIEFLYEFRSYQEWLGIPIIVNSLVPPTEFEKTPVLTNELGVKTYLYKPTTSLTKLVASVKSCIAASA